MDKWNRGVKAKSEALGMSFSKASHMMRKKLLFFLAKKCDMDTCFRCNMKIESLDDFSIEHKESWQNSDDPKKMYFDMENIAFSHHRCNCSARKQTRSVWTRSGFKGVIKDSGKDAERRGKIWRAMISLENRRVNIGRYATPEEAAMEYDKKVVEVFGEDAITNKSLGLL